MLRALILISLVLSGLSCSSATPTFDDSLLEYLPEWERAEIAVARRERDEARDSMAAMERAVVDAENALEQTKLELRVSEAEIQHAQFGLDAAQSGTNSDVEAAQEALDCAIAARDSLAAKIEWREAEIRQAEAERKVATHELALSEAKVQLAKAKAAQMLDRPEARKIEIGHFLYEVRRQENELFAAEIEANNALEAVAMAQYDYMELAQQACQPVVLN